MIKEEVYNYNKEQLIDWLRNEAGSSNPDYFHAKKTGGLKLQQVPEEYAQLLLLLKEKQPKTYLELGIGNGGSFATACFFMQESLSMADAVDCLAYRNMGIGQCEEEIMSFITPLVSKGYDVKFHNATTDNYFKRKIDAYGFDIIFIDADHSYEGVKKDFVNAQKHINDGGLIIFHDIASQACPGIMKIWSEIKSQSQERCIEFIHSETCGIGVVKY